MKVNSSLFKQASYIGGLATSTLLEDFTVSDADVVGDIIEVTCVDVSLSKKISTMSDYQ